MNTKQLILSLTVLAYIVIAPFQSKAATQIEDFDFATAPDFNTRTWAAPPPPTLTSANGGADTDVQYTAAGDYWGSIGWTIGAVDITGADNATLLFDFILNPGHADPNDELVLSLTDSTTPLGLGSHEYRFDITGLAKDGATVHQVAIGRDAGLSYFAGGTPTTTPNFASIIGVDVWAGHPDDGDVATGIVSHDFDVVLVNLQAVPEPHEYALIAGLGLIGFACYRRKFRMAV